MIHVSLFKSGTIHNKSLCIVYLDTLIIFMAHKKEINKYHSADCVVFGYDSKNLNVLLVKRTLSDELMGIYFIFLIIHLQAIMYINEN